MPPAPMLAPPPPPPTHQPRPASATASPRLSSPIVEAGLLLAACVRARARTLAFCRTRKLAELVASHARAALEGEVVEAGGASDRPTRLADRVAAYRGGYEPAHRRAVEAGLFGGDLLGVAATNALELGVDVGDLDVTLHLGVPGAAAALWQQAGRAGRRGGSGALHVIIPFDGPLDSWWAARPGALLARPVEAARCDPATPGLLAAHVACAASEAPPLSVDGDGRWFGAAPFAAAVASLRAAGVLSPLPGSGEAAPPPSVAPAATTTTPLFYTGGPPNPASTFSLRAIDPDAFSVLLEEDRGGRSRGDRRGPSTPAARTLLERVEASKAFFSLYDGAVWLHQGRAHLVKSVDVAGRVAVVRRAAGLAYHTKTRDSTAVRLGAPQVEAGGGGGAPSGEGGGGVPPPITPAAFSGPATVTTRFFGFHRISKSTHRIFDTVDLFLPDVVLETAAAWVGVSPEARAAILGRLGGDVSLLGPALHGAAHALARAAPVVLLCCPGDLGTECGALCGRGGGGTAAPPRLLAYDRAPGGAGGLAPRLAAALAGGLLADAATLIASCTCGEAGGCPCCVQSPDCGEHNACLSKEGAVAVLEEVGRGW